MIAKYILLGIAILFCVLAGLDLQKSGKLLPQRKTQLLVAAIFVLVAALLHFGILG